MQLIMKKEFVVDEKTEKRVVVGLKMNNVNTNRQHYYSPVIYFTEKKRKVEFTYSAWLGFLTNFFMMRNFLMKIEPEHNVFNLTTVFIYLCKRLKVRVLKIRSDVTNETIYYNYNNLVAIDEIVPILKSYHRYLKNITSPAKYLLSHVVKEMKDRYEIDLNTENVFVNVESVESNDLHVNILRYLYQMSEDTKRQIVRITSRQMVNHFIRMREQFVNNPMRMLLINARAVEFENIRTLLFMLLDDICFNNSLQITEIINYNL